MQWRKCTSASAVVEKSCSITPPSLGQSWAERYGEGSKSSWTRYIPFVSLINKKTPEATT